MRQAISLYIHWPFCASKCPYCDFNSHVSETIDQAAWVKAYEQELAFYAELTKGRPVHSIFFGGGTPSLMDVDTVEAVLRAIYRLWDVEEDVEITLEANPTSVESSKFEGFSEAGVNRVSIGVQAFDDESLKFLGRQHSADEARVAIETAARCFDRYSFDLIYARPEHDLGEWRRELTNALAFANGHMSLYQLTIEDGTQFKTRFERGDFSIPDDEQGGRLYEVTQEVMDNAGLPVYEISNHAVKGQESRHNLVYWRYGDYVGIGPGAHGRLTLDDGRKVGTRGHRAPAIWMDRVNAHGHGGHDFEEIGLEQQSTEKLMMGLRLAEGMKFEELAIKIYNDTRVETLIREAFLIRENGLVRPTHKGLACLNSVLGYIV